MRGLPSDIRKRGRADSTAAVRAAGQAVPGLSSLLRRELGPCHAVGGLREPALMSRFFPGHAARRSEPSDPGEPAGAAVYWRALRNADRACCCPARPSVVAVMPAVPGRDHPTDLLLCGHHYRVSRRALAAAGAVILDRAGLPVPPPAAVPAVAR